LKELLFASKKKVLVELQGKRDHLRNWPIATERDSIIEQRDCSITLHQWVGLTWHAVVQILPETKKLSKTKGCD
jgi:hypothetical protein